MGPTRLSVADRVSAAVLAEQVRAHIAATEHRTYLMPINGGSGFYLGTANLPRSHPFRVAVDYEHYLAQLRDLPCYFDENLALLREGLAQGITVPQVVLAGRDGAARAHAEVADVTMSVFYAPFAHLPSTIPDATAARLRADARAAIEEAVIPAYAKVSRSSPTRTSWAHARPSPRPCCPAVAPSTARRSESTSPRTCRPRRSATSACARSRASLRRWRRSSVKGGSRGASPSSSSTSGRHRSSTRRPPRRSSCARRGSPSESTRSCRAGSPRCRG